MKNDNGQSGQALIELIIFLPLMFMLYSLVSGFANAINGSINQQKFTRSYFYFRLQNNSTIITPDKEGTHQNWKKFGMTFLGWTKFYRNGDSPVMPCYRISIPLKAAATDKCDEKYSQTTSQFIRVGTVYGLCGATFLTQGSAVYTLPDFAGSDYQQVVDRQSCLITR